MDFLGPFGKVVEGVVDFVWKHGVRHMTYIVHYKKNVVELSDTVKDLRLEKEKIDHKCEEGTKNLHNIEGKVIEWVRKVSEIETTVDVFENDDGHTRARSPNCFVFPYLWNRHRLGRQAKNLEVGVKKLIDESPELDEISFRENVTSNDVTLSNSGFEQFSSTKSTVEKVMRELENSGVRMIGLYGEGGVGKSALIKEIARIAKEDKKLFSVVVKVEVTANPNIQSIQEEIAYVFGLQLVGEGENVRADCLRRRLKKEKGNTLLILDDLWHKLDLNKLGIPLDDNDDLSNDMRDLDKSREKDKNKKDLNQKVLKREKIIGGHKGCKILLTARQKRVLEVEMDVKSTFRVEPLDDKDALMFFQKLSEIHNMSDSRKEIVRKYCAGLPMAIITVAKALRGKSELVLESALGELQKQELVGIQTNMDISVKMSYDHLENEEIKSIFLLCAQMGHQPLIMDLVKCCYGLGILEGVFSLSEAREKIKITIQKLKDSGLLLDGNSDIHFNMHDIVRDAALSIAKKDKHVFTLRNGKLDQWPELEKCTSISICNCDIIVKLPKVNCSQLNFFQMDTNNQSLTIPDKFFEGMKNLKVLILTGFHLKRFPPSIKGLLKLRMLCLERCTLEDNIAIGELEMLRILSFSGSQLKSLPTVLGCWDKLTLLDINDCSILEVNIPPDILSWLTHLEELYIRKSIGQNSVLCELKNLHQLKVVDLSIPSFSVLPNHLFHDKLQDYKIVVGEVEKFSVIGFKMPDKYETSRVLALHDVTNIDSHEDINLLFKTAQILLLGKVEDVKVVNELSIDGFPDLKHLSIIDSNAIKYVNSMQLSNCINVFPNLESLCLYNLKNLEMISIGPLKVASFCKLKSIKVNMCEGLVSLYSVSMVEFSNSEEPCEIIECNSYLDNFCASLETIEVSECNSLKEILKIPKKCHKVKFLKLQTLTLQSLPSFKCFYTKVEESQAKNSGSEEDQKSDKAPLFGEQVEIPNLESLNLCSLNMHKIWSDQFLSSFCFQNLIKLVVKECDELTYLCSLSVASSLKKLKSLIISECPYMEKIFETKENNADKVCVFPKLEEIQLTKMKRLRDIWHTKVNDDSFSSLISVNIEECNKLDKIFPSNMEGWFESLDNLKVSSCESVEVIFEIKDCEEIDVSGEIDTNLQVILLEFLPKLKELWSKDPHGILNFKKLRTIDVSNCYELRNLFPASMTKDVSNLERMSVLYCDGMGEIVSSRDASEANTDPLEFPELINVRLLSLSNIKQFYAGRLPIKCPKLKELTVSGCWKLKTFSKEISKTTEEEEEEKEENFVFSAQKNLESFCSYKDCEFEFSSLEILIVRECWKMEKFSEKEAITPKLKNVFGVEGDEKSKWHWEDNLNDTIHKVFSDKVSFAYIEELWLDNDTGQFIIDQLWHRRHWVQQNSFGYLKKLRAWQCHTLEHIIPSHLLSCFHNLEELSVRYCSNAEVIFNMNDENREMTKPSGIFRLKILSLESLPQLKHVWDKDPEGIIGLQLLKEMRVEYCESLKSLFPASVAKELTRLEVLEVTECKELAEIFKKEGEGTTKELALGRLTTLMLEELPSLKYSIHCSNQCLSLGENGMKIILRGELERNLLDSLTALTLGFGSDVFEYEILKKEMFCRESPDNVLQQLKVLRLESLRELVSIGIENSWTHSFVGNIEIFEVINCWSLENLVACPVSFSNLTCLKVGSCHGLSYLLTSSTVKSLGKLKRMEIKDCKSIEETVCKEDGEESDEDEIIFPQLTCLNLNMLRKLKRFYKANLGFPSLEERSYMSIWKNGMKMILRGEFERKLLESLKALTLIGSDVFQCKILEQFPNIEKLVVCNGSFKKMFCCESPNNVSFSNLTFLKVDYCNSLSYLLTSSTAKRLDKLKRMEIKNCDSIKEIVCQEDESVEDEIIFPQLTCLNLKGLKKLKMFYRGSLGFPSLEELSIKDCKKMITLCVGTIVTGKLSQVNLELDEYSEAIEWEIDPNSTKMKKYLIETQRESRINLSSRGGLHQIWRGSLSIPNFCFSELVTLIVYDCPFLSDAVLPFHLLPLLPKLNTLEVRNCHSIKTIFDFNPSTQDTLVTLPLNNLVLSNLPNLENIWNADPRGILCMQHLKKVQVKVCKSLRSVFPASVAKDLELEDLVVEECERLVGIVADDNTDPNLQLTLPCPYLRSLKLRKLQKFTYFYYCSHKSDIYTHLESPTEDQLPNEKYMSVGENGMKMILRGEFEKKLLDSLKALTLIGSDVFQCKILEQVPNIETLEMCDGSFKKMFCCESPNNVLQQLKVLRLESIGELVSIGLENSWTHSFVGNIETFEVIRCWSLKNLVASTVSFSNLTSLKVERCGSLSYLLTSSIAKSLGQLKRMEIKECHSIEEIVSKEDWEESDEDEIIFPQLTCLNLEFLFKLKMFYRGSLGFPSLEELSISYCDEMISLCVGSIVGGKMCEVKVGEFSDAIQLETELNSTMTKEYLRKVRL
ncbi:hypothetical protein V8G54_009161 [Vigna mungo]|uniref:AAA+ ATPase domain-containing protein n=1 Tax=Vigna mungo TaxID=3915 RepID=A0AAQ3S1U3_VIGMU